MDSKKILKYSGIFVAVLVIIIVICILIYIIATKVWPKTGTFAGFAAYKNLASYSEADRDPFAAFCSANALLADEYGRGTLTIDKVSMVYFKFLSAAEAGHADNAPVEIVKNIQDLVGYIGTAQDFTSPLGEGMTNVGMGVLNIHRRCQNYMNQLPLFKDKLGGSDPAATKLHNDYINSGKPRDGYINQFLDTAKVEEYSSNTSKAAQYREDVATDLAISSMLDNTDPRNVMREHDYQEYWDNKHAGTKHLAPKQVYEKIDKKYPGTYDRRYLEDDPYTPWEKNPKDPNVPRPGIIGKVPDYPYHYDLQNGIYTRTI